MRWRERDGGLGYVNWTGDRATNLDRLWLLVLGFEVENGRGETALRRD
jgi:hypothetical protein